MGLAAFSDLLLVFFIFVLTFPRLIDWLDSTLSSLFACFAAETWSTLFNCNYKLIQIINDIDDPKTLQILTYENFCRPLDDFVDQKSKTLLQTIEL